MALVIVKAGPPARLLRKRKRLDPPQKILGNSPPPSEDIFDAEAEDANDEQPQKKRRKTNDATSIDELPWKRVKHPLGMGFESDGFMMMLEEVDGVDITKAGDKIEYKVMAKKQKKTRSVRPTALPVSYVDEEFDDKRLLPRWLKLSLRPSLKRSIYSLGFSSPTEIQNQAIAPALQGKDVIGIAETGSGKTLAYGLPIIDHILSQHPHSDTTSIRSLVALILTPTRELAMQVADHLSAVAKYLDPPAPASGPKPPPRVSIGAVIGGIDAHKQMRIINRGMDIMVATPGRLWDIMSEHEEVAKSIRQIRFLVLDEADRMIETGHFAELDKIVKLTLRPSNDDKPEDDPEFAVLGLPAEELLPNPSLQTMIFSATMSKDLQKNLKRKGGSKKPKKRSMKVSSTLDDLLMKLDFRDKEPVVIDLSPEKGVVSTLQESKVECVVKDKDAYLYYFLTRYPGRSLVFLGSIDGIRRLHPILRLLNVDAIPLHSQLEQKQRLRNLEKFRASSNAVLVATDIAARGLDIPSVDHVVHYQLPRAADVYVHRSGRTARAKKDGFSLLLVTPDERKVEKGLLQSLDRQDDIPELNVDLDVLDKLKQRVSLARRIDAVEHKQTKVNHDQNWLKRAAKDLEVDIDLDFVDGPTKAQSSKVLEKEKQESRALKLQLNQLLKEPLTASGVSANFLTSTVNGVADDLISGLSHQHILGAKNTSAGRNSVRKVPTEQASKSSGK